jgi:hypothetical protein
MKIQTDKHGLQTIQFEDRDETLWSLRESGQPDEPCLWMGADKPYYKRMHLTQDHIRELLPLLQHFAETGKLPESDDDDNN